MILRFEFSFQGIVVGTLYKKTVPLFLVTVHNETEKRDTCRPHLGNSHECFNCWLFQVGNCFTHFNGPFVSFETIALFQMNQLDCFLSGDNKCFAFLFHLQQLIFSVFVVSSWMLYYEFIVSLCCHPLLYHLFSVSLLLFSVIFTPHVCDVWGVIVLTSSACLCVCYHSHDQTDRHTDLNFGM